MEGLHLTINNQELFCRLVGVFNAYNLLAVYAAAHLLEEESQKLLMLLSNLKTAEGRFDTIIQKGKIGIVDYAHTPDALVETEQKDLLWQLWLVIKVILLF